MRNRTLIVITIILFAFQKTPSQTLNLEMDATSEHPFLLGKIDKEGLTSEPYSDWFLKNYHDYQVDLTVVENIAPILKDYQIVAFMGTWCGDSQKEVPRFYKVLEACNFPMTQLSVIAVSRKPYMYKQSPNHEEAGRNIHRVPTFIFYKNGREVNRIVEHPVVSFEEDMHNILSSNDYKSNYQIVSDIHSILKLDGLKGLKKKAKQLVKRYDGKVTSMFELNTYGRVLYNSNKIDEAIEVFRLNTLLFPKEPRTYMSLANTVGIYGDAETSVDILKKALKLFPENQDLIENLKALESNL